MPDSETHFLCSLKIWINYFRYSSLTMLSQVSGSFFPALSAIRHAVMSWLSYTRITVQLCAAHTFVTLCFSLPSFNWLAPQLLLTKNQVIFLQLSPPLTLSLVTYDIFYRESTWFLLGHSEGIIGPSWSKHYNVNTWKWPLIHFLTDSVFRLLFILNFRSLALTVGIGPELKVFR